MLTNAHAVEFDSCCYYIRTLNVFVLLWTPPQVMMHECVGGSNVCVARYTNANRLPMFDLRGDHSPIKRVATSGRCPPKATKQKNYWYS